MAGSAEKFLIETELRGRRLREVWDPARPYSIGKPFLYAIERTSNGIRVRNLHHPSYVEITDEQLAQGARVPLPGDLQGAGHVAIQAARAIRPGFENPENTKGLPAASGLWCLYECIDHWVMGSALLEPETEYEADGGLDRTLFKITRLSTATQMEVLGTGIEILHSDGTVQSIAPKQGVRIPDAELDQVIIRRGNRFWRFSRVVNRKQVDTLEQNPFPTHDNLVFEKAFRWTVGAMVGVMILLQVMPMPKVKEVVQEQEIKIYMPEPKKAAEPTPEPTRVPEPTRTPAPPKPKAAEKPPAPAPKAPAPKKQAPPPPPPAPKANLKPQAPVVKAPPPPVEAPKAPPPPTAEQIAAQKAEATKAKLSSALNFLSTSKVAVSKVNTTQYAVNQPNAYQASNTTATVQSNSALRSLASGANIPSAAISTRGSKSINAQSFSASDVGVPGGKGKHLNQVYAKVNFGSGEGRGLGGGIGDGSGTEVSGQGQLSQSEIEKALSKHLDRFQYCYEKALLSNSNLGGSIVMRWDISAGGDPSNAQVAQSKANDEGLHSCMKKELLKVKFPKPRGGSVNVKYQFNFQKTSI